MKGWHVEIKIDPILSAPVGNSYGIFEFSPNHKGPITLVIKESIERINKIIGTDCTDRIKIIEAWEIV